MEEMSDMENLIARVRFSDMPQRLREDILEALRELSDARNDLQVMHKAIEELERETSR